MKRYNNLFEKVCDIDNIELADSKARKNKGENWGIIKHDRERDNLDLLKNLKNLTYNTSE